METPLAFTMSEGMWTVAIGQFVLLAGLVIKGLVDWVNRQEDRKDREQDRMDRVQLATLTVEQLEVLAKAGTEREKRIIEQVVQTKNVSIKAFREANGINKKIESIGMQIVEAKDQPIKAEIVNTQENPVHTVTDTDR